MNLDNLTEMLGNGTRCMVNTVRVVVCLVLFEKKMTIILCLNFRGLGISEGVREGLNEGESGVLIASLSEGVNTELLRLVTYIDAIPRKLATTISKGHFTVGH